MAEEMPMVRKFYYFSITFMKTDRISTDFGAFYRKLVKKALTLQTTHSGVLFLGKEIKQSRIRYDKLYQVENSDSFSGESTLCGVMEGCIEFL